jgi:glutathione transport system permease protein
VPGLALLAYIARRLLVSVPVLVGSSMLLAILTGVISAIRQYSRFDYATTFLTFLFFSMPAFWFAALLKSGGIWYNQNVSAGTFYTIGDHSVVLTDTSFWGRSVDVAGHLVLPTVALSLAVYGGWTRFARASVLEVMNSDHVRLARSKGLRAGRVLVRHTLRDIDVYLLMGWLLVTGAVIIVFNLIADLLYGILDPRIRVG